MARGLPKKPIYQEPVRQIWGSGRSYEVTGAVVVANCPQKWSAVTP